MSGVYYNDNEPFVCEWLCNLIREGHLPAGDVDDRSILEVRPDDLKGYTQAHFFAGIGGWPLALQLAKWPEDQPVWTGSCPCQPFSAAGRGKGADDARHLWPTWFQLIRECRPPAVFGEQVASPLGRAWLAAVRADLEEVGYAVGAADLCAAGVGAPHIRQRLWYMAESRRQSTRRGLFGPAEGAESTTGRTSDQLSRSDVTGVAQGDADYSRSQGQLVGWDSADQRPTRSAGVVDFWTGCSWLPCRDGKARPVEPGTLPLAHGVPTRVGRLRAYGNAIVPWTAAEFIMAYQETRIELEMAA